MCAWEWLGWWWDASGGQRAPPFGNPLKGFALENPTIDTVCDHIFHFLEMDPCGKHIALGGDLDGVEKMPAGFDGVQSWPKLADRLMERGLTEPMIRDIFWNNAAKFFNFDK